MASVVEPLLRRPTRFGDLYLSPATLLGLVRAADGALLALAAFAAWRWRGEPLPPDALPLAVGLAALLFLNLGELACVYKLRTLRQGGEQAGRAVACLVPAFLGVALFDAAGLRPVLPGGFLLACFLAAAPLLAASRVLLPDLLRRLERHGLLATRVVVVGAGEQGQRLVQRLRATPSPFRLVGLFDDRRTRVPQYIGGCPVLGGLDELVAFAERRPVDMVVVALPWFAESRILDCLRRLRQVPADVLLCPDLAGLHLGHRGVTNVAGLPLLNVYDRPLTRRMRLLKAAEDYLLASLALLLTGPLMLLVALAVRLTSRGPAFYTQVRVGRGGRLFTIYKIRTMVHNCESLTGPRWSLPGDPRVTPVGWFLRLSHLDELPQLWNVLRGEMSLVGPRPERPEFVPELECAIPRYRERLRVRPGVTGLAQVQQSADTGLESVRSKLAYDLYYIESVTPWLDLRILLSTAFKMVGVPFPVRRKLFAMPSGAEVEGTYRRALPRGKAVPQVQPA